MVRGPRRKRKLGAIEGGEAPQQTEEPPPKTGAKKRKQSSRETEIDGLKEFKVMEPEDKPVSGLEAAARILAKWADDSTQLQRWLSSRGGGLEGHLDDNKGCVFRLLDFMPLRVADAVLEILENLAEEAWQLSEQDGDEGAASHRFSSVDVCDIPELASLRSVLWRALPSFRGEPTLPIFSCGRYGASHFIGKHDDRAHVPFFNGDRTYSRTVAGIWYLTRDWTAADGGLLQDLEASAGAEKTFVPTFNSFGVFEVPHEHVVTPVTADRYRYSIFGWWHQEGKRYELPGAEGAVSSAKKKKLKKKADKNEVVATDSGLAAYGLAADGSILSDDEDADKRPKLKRKKLKKKAVVAENGH